MGGHWLMEDRNTEKGCATWRQAKQSACVEWWVMVKNVVDISAVVRLLTAFIYVKCILCLRRWNENDHMGYQ